MRPGPEQLAKRLRELAAKGGPGAASQASAGLLAELRSIDQAGAAAVLAADAQAGRLLAAWPGQALELAGRLLALSQRAACLRCGSCCRTSSPTLYLEDWPLIESGALRLADLYALRAGERAFSARLGRSLVLDQDLIKLREDSSAACRHLTPVGCGIYQSRPLQCRHLECWSGRHGGQLQDRPRLGRTQLWQDDPTALALMAEYEAELPAAGLDRLLAAAARGDPEAPGRALLWLERDHRLRAGARERYGYHPDRLELLWGRPALAVVADYDLQVALDPGGKPCLQPRSRAEIA